MKKEDLRIGNLYNSAKWKIPVTCDLSDFYDLCALADGATDHPPISERFLPLPITEELLKKFGCKSIGKLHPTYKIKNYIIEAPILEWKNNWGFRQIINKDESVWLKDVSFMHELQNLYYALRSDELVLAVTPKRKN